MNPWRPRSAPARAPRCSGPTDSASAGSRSVPGGRRVQHAGDRNSPTPGPTPSVHHDGAATRRAPSELVSSSASSSLPSSLSLALAVAVNPRHARCSPHSTPASRISRSAMACRPLRGSGVEELEHRGDHGVGPPEHRTVGGEFQFDQPGVPERGNARRLDTRLGSWSPVAISVGARTCSTNGSRSSCRKVAAMAASMAS